MLVLLMSTVSPSLPPPPMYLNISDTNAGYTLDKGIFWKSIFVSSIICTYLDVYEMNAANHEKYTEC